MVCGRRPRRVLKLRSRKTDAVRKLSIHHSPLLFTSQTHVCSDTGAAHDQRRHTLAISYGQWLFSAHTEASETRLMRALDVSTSKYGRRP